MTIPSLACKSARQFLAENSWCLGSRGARIEVTVNSVSISPVYWHHYCVRVSLYRELLDVLVREASMVKCWVAKLTVR